MNRGYLLMAGLGLVLGQAGSALAQAGDGRVNAAIYGKVPAGSAVAVLPLDDTENNLQIKGMIERELAARGYRIAANASFVMTFWTGGSYDLARRTKPGPGLLRLGAEGGTRIGDTEADVEAQITLFSSRGGGLFQNPAKRGSQKPLGSARHRLDAVLRDQGNGKRVWQGQAYADVSGGDSFAVSEAMVPALLETFGKTVRQKSFTVD